MARLFLTKSWYYEKPEQYKKEIARLSNGLVEAIIEIPHFGHMTQQIELRFHHPDFEWDEILLARFYKLPSETGRMAIQYLMKQDGPFQTSAPNYLIKPNWLNIAKKRK
jgi:hypothetical protein